MRTGRGAIGKIEKLESKNECFPAQYKLDCEVCGNSIANIKKHSKNIIDLIEEGDIVNGDLLVYKGKTANETEKLLVGNHIIRGMALEIVDIKKVVTKEQFTSIEYKVEAEVKKNEN